MVSRCWQLARTCCSSSVMPSGRCRIREATRRTFGIFARADVRWTRPTRVPTGLRGGQQLATLPNGRRTVLLSAPEPRWIGLIHLPWASSAETAFIAALGGGDEDGLLAARGQRLFGGPPEVLRGCEFGVPFGIVCSPESETNALSGNVFRAASARLCHSCQLSATSIASGAPVRAPSTQAPAPTRHHGRARARGRPVGEGNRPSCR